MSLMGVFPPLSAQGDKKWPIFIKLAYNGHFIAWIVKKQPKHEFVNSPTFLKKSEKLVIYNPFRGLKCDFFLNHYYTNQKVPSDPILSLKSFLDPTRTKSPMT